VEASNKAVKAKALVADIAQLAQTQSMLALGVYRVLNFAREKKGIAQ